MSLLLLFGGAEQGAGPVFTAVDTELVIALPDFMIRGAQYVVPFLATEGGQPLGIETGELFIDGEVLTMDDVAIPALYVRKVQ